jgi:hypothetical protein
MTTIKSNLFEGYDMIIIKIRSGANILLWFKAAKGNHPQNVDYLPIIIYYLSISIDFFHMFHVFFLQLTADVISMAPFSNRIAARWGTPVM